jgi:biopolymer transport protein ExbB/biopolymer transport protein TolQ
MVDQLITQSLMSAGRFLVSLTLVVLAAFSVYSLAVIGERWWTFRRSRLASAGLLARVLACLDQGKLHEALLACEQERGSHVGSVLAAGLRELQPLASKNPGLHAGDALDRAGSSAREAMEHATAGQIGRLEHRLTSLATLGNISPFVGLFGTVLGVMRAFEAIARTGSGGLGTVSAGIAEALVATAAGLFVAIPAVTAYNHFVSRVKAFATEMDGAASTLLVRVQHIALKDPWALWTNA